MAFTAVDCIFGIIIFIFAIVALSKGFVDEVFGKAAWVLGVISAYVLYRQFAVYFNKISSEILRNILSFILIFVCVFIFVKILGLIIGKIFEFSILKSLDRSLGFFFGLIEGFAVICLLIFILKNQPFYNFDELFSGSFFYKAFDTLMQSSEFMGVKQNV